MKLKAIGLDLAKDAFQVHADEQEQVVLRRQLKRSQVMAFFARLQPCLVGMEACASAHHWGRQLRGLGHEVRLIAPKFVKPYVKSNKNDQRDAKVFDSGRGFAAWLGITPGEHSSGGKQRLLGITKRGDSRIRTLLIHGARSVIQAHRSGSDPWLDALLARRPKNVAIVAVARRNARILWALLASGQRYQPRRAVAAI